VFSWPSQVQRLAGAEAVLRDSAASSCNAGAGMNASSKGSAAVEAKLKKLTAEVKGMEIRMTEVLARGGTQVCVCASGSSALRGQTRGLPPHD
jgi:hypothetical protein